MSLYSKIITPQFVLIEQVAGQLAATYYEVGRGQGLKSKYKTARLFAKHNLEKFIPKATEYLLSMLSPTSGVTEEMRMMIYEAMIERVNDPGLCEIMPNIDVKKVIEQIEIVEKKKQIVINTKPKWCKTHNREANRCLSQGGSEGGIMIACQIIDKPAEPKTVLHNG